LSKDNNQIIFYGFVVGSVLLLMPVPSFFFWRDTIDQIETLFRYIGFVLFAICGITIIIRVIRTFFGK
jgi:putative Mn2+ efflux pump MntP